MHQATGVSGGASPDNQQHIEFSKSNWIVFAGLMLASWYSGLSETDPDLPIESFYGGRPIIKRIVNQPVDLVDPGIVITPTDGWTYLKVTGKKSKRSLTFVNEKENLVVAIKPVHFAEWPPTFKKQSRTGDSADTPTTRVAKKINAVEYKSVTVEWFSLQHLPYATYHDGRIDTDQQEFMIRIMSQQGYTDEQMAAVTRLCDQIIRTP